MQGRDAVRPALVKDAAGVLLIGGDQGRLTPALSDRAFTATVRAATRGDAVTWTEGAMTAAMGNRYAAGADPTAEGLEDFGIAAFRTDGTRFRSGLAVVDATLEPMLTREYRWGRVYNASAHDPRTPALGVSELTALAVDGASRRVVGDRSVIAVDGRDATYDAGSNGALVATNVLLTAFAPGDRLP